MYCYIVYIPCIYINIHVHVGPCIHVYIGGYFHLIYNSISCINVLIYICILIVIDIECEKDGN